jgi:hypothetical protein
MTPEDIKRTMLGWEGQAIEVAGRQGTDEACTYLRAQVDGLVNGLIRLQGAEKTASYLFALTDRAAAGIRCQTMWPPGPPAAPMSVGGWIELTPRDRLFWSPDASPYIVKRDGEDA